MSVDPWVTIVTIFWVAGLFLLRGILTCFASLCLSSARGRAGSPVPQAPRGKYRERSAPTSSSKCRLFLFLLVPQHSFKSYFMADLCSIVVSPCLDSQTVWIWTPSFIRFFNTRLLQQKGQTHPRWGRNVQGPHRELMMKVMQRYSE